MNLESQSKPTDKVPVSNLGELLRSMNPRLNDGVYVFVSVPPDAAIDSLKPIATFLEDEGISIIVEESQVEGTDIRVLFRAAWITLAVNSDLHAVGLTAAVANALANKGISCNIVAGANHDHLFVPLESTEATMEALSELQAKREPFRLV
jgi:uncharacterized protein